MKQNIIFLFILLLSHYFIYSAQDGRNVLSLRMHYLNTVEKILIAPDNNNLFVCYSGYGIIKKWERDGGNYRVEPIYSHKTNIIAEINLNEKIEHELYCAPINNQIPVADITKHNNQYFIVHDQYVYICTKSKNIFSNDTLTPIVPINYNEKLQKIFIDNEKNNIIAISQNGNIFKTIIPNNLNNNQKQTPIYTISNNPKIKTIIYNDEQLFFGLLGKILIYSFKNNTTQTITLKSNFPVYTIDINKNHLLASDINPSQFVRFTDLFKLSDNLHTYDNMCCQEKLYLLKSYEEMKKQIRSGTLEEIKQQTKTQKEEIKKNALLHHDPQIAQEKPEMPDSCNKKTIYLISLKNELQSKNNINTLQHNKHEYRINKDIISFVSLRDDQLIIGKRKERDGLLFIIPIDYANSEILKQNSDSASYKFPGELQLHKINNKIIICGLYGYCTTMCQSYCHCPEKYKSKSISDVISLITDQNTQIKYSTSTYKIMLNRILFYIKQKIYHTFYFCTHPTYFGIVGLCLGALAIYYSNSLLSYLIAANMIMAGIVINLTIYN